MMNTVARLAGTIVLLCCQKVTSFVPSAFWLQGVDAFKNTQDCLLFSKVMLLSILLSTISISQSIEDKTNDSKNNSNYLQIGFINESAIYYHYSFGSSLNLKSGIAAFWNYEDKKDGEEVNQSVGSDPTGSWLSENKGKYGDLHNSYEIVLSSILFYQLNNYEYATFHLGVGPSILYSNTKNSQSSVSSGGSSVSKYGSESNSEIVGLGPSLAFMITSHIYKSLLLVSEYNFTAYYTWNTDNRSNSQYQSAYPSYWTTQTHQEANGWQLRFSYVRVGVLIEL